MTGPAALSDDVRRTLERRLEADVGQALAILEGLGYPASRFRLLVERDGAWLTTVRLILDREPSYGLAQLQRVGGLDTNVEILALLPWYEPLFAEVVRDYARRKLRLFGVDVDGQVQAQVGRLSAVDTDRPAAEVTHDEPGADDSRDRGGGVEHPDEPVASQNGAPAEDGDG